MSTDDTNPETLTYYQRHRAERLAYQKAYNQYFGALYDPKRYENERDERLAYQGPYYAANCERLLARQAAYYQRTKTRTATDDTLPPQYVGHCGEMQLLTQLPHICSICGAQLFNEIEVPHG